MVNVCVALVVFYQMRQFYKIKHILKVENFFSIRFRVECVLS